MIRHSIGGRSTSNTIVPQLEKGLRFGFVASSDDHRGYPGAYGEGVLGVWASELTRRSLLEAIRARRTYAATGDRITLEVTLNGQPMGSQLPVTADRQIDVRIEGQDSIAMVELIRNGRVIERYFPEDDVEGPIKLPGRAKFRMQYGWGPWAALDLGRTCQWDMTIRLTGGRILRAVPCFQAGPYEENLRDKLRLVSDSEIHLQSFTSRIQCYAEDPTKAMECEIEAQPQATLTVRLHKPTDQTVSAKLSDLIEDNVVTFTGVFTTPEFLRPQDGGF